MTIMKVLRILYRSFVLAILIYTLEYDYIVIDLDVDREILEKMAKFLKGRVLFATHLSFIFQIVFHFLALINELVTWTKSAHVSERILKVQLVKDYVFAVFAFPLSLFISSTFWIIYAIDRELIFPVSQEQFIPRFDFNINGDACWVNHVFHTLTAFFIIMEMFLSCRRYPSRRDALKGFFFIYIWYMFWVYFGKIYADVWPYKFMNLMSLPMVIAFNIVMGPYLSLFYFAGEFVNNKFWSKKLQADLEARNRINNDD